MGFRVSMVFRRRLAGGRPEGEERAGFEGEIFLFFKGKRVGEVFVYVTHFQRGFFPP